jgi:S-(hydroxymethyl)glutathione dehydrogenase/alcohol dehydrogenase
MRAAILTETGKPLTVAELSMPSLGVGQVRVKVEYAAICGAQIGEIDAVKGPDKYLPHLLGHEGVGQVTEIGPGVTTKAIGDWVILHWRPGEGINAKGPIYRWPKDTAAYPAQVNAGPMTCFSDETIVSENRLTKLPEGVDHRVAPLYGCAFTTAYGVVVNDARIKPGDRVIVFGFGGVGMAVASMAINAGATVVCMDRVPGKIPAVLAWDGNEQGFDVAVDITGASDVIETAYRVTHKTGRVVLVGVPRKDDPISIDSLPLHFGKQIIGSQGGWCIPHEDIPRIAGLSSGFRSSDGWISDEFSLEDINVALDVVRSGKAMRVLVRMAS